jgi:hypothetical protein
MIDTDKKTIKELMKKLNSFCHYNRMINILCQEIVDSKMSHLSAESLAMEVLYIQSKLIKENFKTINQEGMH